MVENPFKQAEGIIPSKSVDFLPTEKIINIATQLKMLNTFRIGSLSLLILIRVVQMLDNAPTVNQVWKGKRLVW